MLWLATATYVHATIGGTVATKAADADWWERGATIASAVVALFTAWLAWSTRKLAAETKQSISVSQAGLRLELVREARVVAPLLVARIKQDSTPLGSGSYAILESLDVTNKGQGVALKVRFAARMQDGTPLESASYILPPIAPTEEFSVSGFRSKLAVGLRDLRIRYEDIYGNRYITEYHHLGNRTDLPVFRRPWIAKELNEPRPDLWSGDVSWPIADYEPISGWPDEGVEPGAERAPSLSVQGPLREAFERSRADDSASE